MNLKAHGGAPAVCCASHAPSLWLAPVAFSLSVTLQCSLQSLDLGFLEPEHMECYHKTWLYAAHRAEVQSGSSY